MYGPTYRPNMVRDWSVYCQFFLWLILFGAVGGDPFQTFRSRSWDLCFYLHLRCLAMWVPFLIYFVTLHYTFLGNDFFSTLISQIYSPRLDTAPPRWVHLAHGVLLFLYQVWEIIKFSLRLQMDNYSLFQYVQIFLFGYQIASWYCLSMSG
jgi:hypothetical protein